MKIDINNLPNSPDLLRKIIFDMHAEVASYKEKYARLLEEFRLNKNRLFSSSSEKNVFQKDLFDEPDVALSDEIKEQLSDEIEVKTHTRKKHPVRRSLPKDLPRERIVHDISEDEKICACTKPLVRIGEEITEQLKFIPSRLSVVQHVRPKYACKPCQENVKIAPMPILFLPKCIATPELVAHTIISKYCDHLPLYRQENIWTRLDVDLPRSSLCGWILKTAELCEPLIRLLQKIIIHYDYVQADETTVQVLAEVGRDNTAKSYMWCYRGGGQKICIVYDYQSTRGGYHAAKFLEGFKGYLQSDAYSGYNFADKNEAITKVGCMAHARRKFADIVKISTSKGLAHEAIKYFSALYKIERRARNDLLTADARQTIRQKESLPILTSFKLWLDTHLTKTPEQSKISGAIRYALSNWDALTNYLKDGRLEIDNNLLENAIRPFALGRKNWLFAGSPTGAKAGAILYSLIETCKANHVEPYNYFCAMLHRIRLCKTQDDYLKLLPQFIEF